MGIIEGLTSGLLQAVSLSVFPYLVIGAVFGLLIGVIPGLSGHFAMAMVIPFLYSMEPGAGIAFLLGAVLLLYIARRLRHWYRNRYRREALAELGKLAQAGSGEAWLTELNRLLKLTALAGYPRERFAQLCGREWVGSRVRPRSAG